MPPKQSSTSALCDKWDNYWEAMDEYEQKLDELNRGVGLQVEPKKPERPAEPDPRIKQ